MAQQRRRRRQRVNEAADPRTERKVATKSPKKTRPHGSAPQ